MFHVLLSGTFLLTELLLDKLKASAPSRIITTIAAAANLGEIDFDNINLRGGYSPGKAFAQSKFAIVLYSLHLAQRLKGGACFYDGKKHHFRSSTLLSVIKSPLPSEQEPSGPVMK